MPRPPRFTYAHAVHHVTLRCNNREFLFAEPSLAAFVELLREARASFPLSLYNYCLMTNHVHLLFKVGRDDTLSKAMHWLSTSLVKRFNSQTGRIGHLWGQRFRSTIIEDDAYFFRAMAYVDLNPVRAGMVPSPAAHAWSGHRALRDEDGERLDFHSLYLELGGDAASRYRAYADMVSEEMARPPVPLATKYFVGRPAFVRRMEARFGLRVGRGYLEWQPLGGGVVASGPRIGGGPSRNDEWRRKS
jgi:putative transposase